MGFDQTTKQLLKKALKNLQSRFIRSYMDKEEVDDLRKKVTRPIWSKKYKRNF